MTLRTSIAACALAALAFATPAVAQDKPAAWTGFHAGIHGGWDITTVDLGGPIDLSDSKLAFGGSVGALYRVPGTIFAVGADVDYTWARATIMEHHWSATARGGVILGNVMPYVLAGYHKANATGGLSADGWIAGGGLEFALGPNIFLDGQYRYTSYGVTGPIDVDQHEVRLGVKYRFGL